MNGSNLPLDYESEPLAFAMRQASKRANIALVLALLTPPTGLAIGAVTSNDSRYMTDRVLRAMIPVAITCVISMVGCAILRRSIARLLPGRSHNRSMATVALVIACLWPIVAYLVVAFGFAWQ